MQRRCRAILWLGAVLAAPLPAQQFTLLDGTFTYTRDGHIGDMPAKETPASWLQPVNYKDGTVYIRLEVLEKAGSTPVNYLCRVLSGEHADRSKNGRIGFQRVVVSKPGIYHFTEPMKSMEPLTKPSTFVWDGPIRGVQPVVADAAGQMVSVHEHELGTFRGAMADYFPLRAHYTAIVVAKGASFVPPAGWEADEPVGTASLPGAVTNGGELSAYKFVWISIRTGDSELYVVDGDTGNLTNLSRKPNASERYPAWSWDGRKIAFNSDRDGAHNLYVMDADGGNLKQLTQEVKPAQTGMMSWTADGRWIYFGIFGKGVPQMCRIHPDGSGFEFLAYGIDPAISPDGKTMVYAKDSHQGHYVYAADGDGKNERQLTKDPNAFAGVHAAWTPDSKHILYADRVDEAEELFLSDPNGSKRKQLTFLKQAATSPTVSPDGKWVTFRLCDEVYWRNSERSKLAYAEHRADKRPVWIMGIDGSNPHVIELMHWGTTIDGSRAPITLK